MSNYRRANTAGGTYFFTVVSYRRQKILCDERVRDALREGIDRTRQKYPLQPGKAWLVRAADSMATFNLAQVYQRRKVPYELGNERF